MRTFKFIPKECTDQVIKEEGKPDVVTPKTFEGHVELKVPSHTERLTFLDKGAYEVNAAGEVERLKSGLAIAVRYMELAKDFILHVHLKRLDDGTELKSYDDLNHEPGGEEILGQIVLLLQKGFRPSKN